MKEGAPPYTASLDAKLPQETFIIHRSSTWKQGGRRWLILEIRDAIDKNTLYLFEACHTYRHQMLDGEFYRISDYPLPVARVHVDPIGLPGSREGPGYETKSRRVTATPVLLQLPSIVETPDRFERRPWSPRRFIYGGRRFVWKAKNKVDSLQPESLHEYTSTKPMPGSKTGKKDDDAGKELFWGDRPSLRNLLSKWTVHFVGGLDQGFKEHILAIQMMKIAVIYTAQASR